MNKRPMGLQLQVRVYDKAEEAGGTFFLPSLCRGGSWTEPTDPP